MKKLSYVFLGIVIGGLLTFFLTPKPVKEAVPVVIKPKGVITQAEAMMLNDNWTKYRKKVVDSAAKAQGADKDDTRSVEWSLKEIEDYLAWAKKEADTFNYKMTGIRVYLGVYGKNAGQAKKDLTTMFIAPIGKVNKAQASSLNLRVDDDEDLPVDPLNRGTGGQNDYP
ncbi:hypothetical protein RBH94_12890 [Aestuariibaculum sp. YM273]|uniref:hypothetical protein n=1 Tax=Aestuariibaculum sp. YM273 TaxID=3070659 RepID=UPI0027DDAB3E|nr:hypothetical protein [Aestuariibaculum sp. YM273]WMI64952.1 hypothetical protein RBH94_12890 [Aestuariibaculum sp. YM273]